MANINLLPSDLGPKASILRLAAFFKKILAGALVIFCVFSGLTITYIVFLNTQIKKANANSEVLKKSIKSLEQTEQKLFLVKDRLGNIKSLVSSQTPETGLGSFERVLVNGSAVTFTQVSAAPGEIDIQGGSFSSRALGDFLESILVNPDYKTVNLASFSFSSSAGYLFELGVSTK